MSAPREGESPPRALALRRAPEFAPARRQVARVNVVRRGRALVEVWTSGLWGGLDNRAGATLTLQGTTVSGNSAVFGGGIYIADATVTLTASAVTGNTAFVAGGGIFKVGGPPEH
jgi:predicted outer membrane repeat protein